MPATLDAAPPLPDAIKSQMGNNNDAGFAGIGGMMAEKEGGSPAADGGPQGAIKMQIDTMKKVLEKVIQSAGPGKTFFSRAAQLLEQGLAAEVQKGPGTPPGKQEAPAGATGMTSPPAFAG